MTDGTLNMLADEEWSLLDLAGCSLVSDSGLVDALGCTRRLRALDLSGCLYSTATLRQLPQLCPQLQILRLGAPHKSSLHSDLWIARLDLLRPHFEGLPLLDLKQEFTELGFRAPPSRTGGRGTYGGFKLSSPCTGGSEAADRSAARALKHIVPLIEQPAAESECWEMLAAAPDGGGRARLAGLHQLMWPDCPPWVLQQLASMCPKLQVNAHGTVARAAMVSAPSTAMAFQAFSCI